MSYWRMQLHPNDAEYASFYTINSLANGFIGLDFGNDPGDLEKLKECELEKTPNNIYAFVKEITRTDVVIIFLHHHPFAIVRNVEEYNYIKQPIDEVNIWFRHFRKFKDISYYSDVFGTIKDEHKNIKMSNTFSGVSEDSETGKLIQGWLRRLE